MLDTSWKKVMFHWRVSSRDQLCISPSSHLHYPSLRSLRLFVLASWGSSCIVALSRIQYRSEYNTSDRRGHPTVLAPIVTLMLTDTCIAHTAGHVAPWHRLWFLKDCHIRTISWRSFAKPLMPLSSAFNIYVYFPFNCAILLRPDLMLSPNVKTIEDHMFDGPCGRKLFA